MEETSPALIDMEDIPFADIFGGDFLPSTVPVFAFPKTPFLNQLPKTGCAFTTMDQWILRIQHQPTNPPCFESVKVLRVLQSNRSR